MCLLPCQCRVRRITLSRESPNTKVAGKLLQFPGNRGALASSSLDYPGSVTWQHVLPHFGDSRSSETTSVRSSSGRAPTGSSCDLPSGGMTSADTSRLRDRAKPSGYAKPSCDNRCIGSRPLEHLFYFSGFATIKRFSWPIFTSYNRTMSTKNYFVPILLL